jgi:DNA-binding MarR family transcriptional regulator
MSTPGRADEALLLDNQLCVLVYRLHRGITDLYRPLLAELGLTYPQYLVMLSLWESDPSTVSRLGHRLDLDSGTLSPLLKRLESAGLVRRTRARADERSVEVSLTDEGRALRSRARHVPAAVAAALAGSEDDYWTTRELLTALLDRLESAAGPTAPSSAP